MMNERLIYKADMILYSKIMGLSLIFAFIEYVVFTTVFRI